MKDIKAIVVISRPDGTAVEERKFDSVDKANRFVRSKSEEASANGWTIETEVF